MAFFSMFAGDTKVLHVTVKDQTGAVVNITGYLIRWKLALRVTSPPLLSKAVGTGITIVDGPGGRFDVALASGDTEALSGKYYYEAETNNGGVISTVLTGNVRINPALIKAA